MKRRAGLIFIFGSNLLALLTLLGIARAHADSAQTDMLAATGAAAVLLCTLLVWRQARQAGRHDTLLLHHMQALGEGRLSLAPQPDDGHGMMLAAFSSRMADVVARVRNGTAGFAMTSGLLSNDNKALLQRTDRQAALLQQTASSTEQITSNVRQNADNADKANELICAVAQAAAHGGEVVAGVERNMAGIRDSSRRIADIISVVDGIAFQTNILALNAAVEAARAGESGRGFAVVAAEVRVLAHRVAAASKEIQLLIGDSVGKVESCDRQVVLAGEAMRSIVSSVSSAASIMSEISHASREQSAGVADINNTITQLDRMTQENARLADEISAAAGNLYRQAVTLTDVVSRFDLGSSEFGSRDDAVRLVDAAIAFAESDGLPALAGQVNDTTARCFADRDLYLVVADIASGCIVAHGGNPRLVGVDTRQHRDPEGKPFGRQIVDTARDHGSGWVDFKFAHPITQEVRAKSAYVRRAGDCLVSCGFYAS